MGVAAATASHASCRIGDAGDMMARGVVSHANALARALGVAPGMACRDAGLSLIAARPSDRDPDACGETRRVLDQAGWRRRIVLIDSASLIDPGDKGQIVVTASHGALVGGNARMALQVDGFAAVFSDAGVGRDNAGISRLRRSMAAALPALPFRPPRRASATPRPSTRTASSRMSTTPRARSALASANA
jgi:hypothetical protein